MNTTSRLNLLALLTLCGAMSTPLAVAQQSRLGLSVSPTVQSWMSPEVGDAWDAGYKGAGVTITVVDDFKSRSRFSANLGDGSVKLRHGEWTLKEASMIAPLATASRHDFYSGRTVALASGLNVINLSYSMYARTSSRAPRWDRQEQSIINYATNGQAVIAKAAGNDGVALDQANARRQVDTLNLALRGTQSVIFVGALNTNGSVQSPATLASYSNTAGTNTTVQAQYLVVGVAGDTTGLYGTSFAAPIVSGYAAILGSKFTSATPTQITNQLLTTARMDTILNYNAVQHGRGEASISRALSPVSIN